MINLNIQTELVDLMQALDTQMNVLRAALLEPDVIRAHQVYEIKPLATNRHRDRAVSLFDIVEHSVDALFVIHCSDPQDTKQTIKFPGYLSICPVKYELLELKSLVDNVNSAKLDLKEFFVKHCKPTAVETKNGFVTVANPLLFECYPMVSACQLLRKIVITNGDINRVSFGWINNKRYDDVSKESALRSIYKSKANPPLNHSSKAWDFNVQEAIDKLEQLPDEFIIKRIKQSPSVAKLSIKSADSKFWLKHYVPQPMLIVNQLNRPFDCSQDLKDIQVADAKSPVLDGWKPISEAFHLYVK